MKPQGGFKVAALTYKVIRMNRSDTDNNRSSISRSQFEFKKQKALKSLSKKADSVLNLSET